MWQYRRFEECLDKVPTASKIPKKAFLDDGSYPVISQEKDFINGYWDKEDDLFKVHKPIVIFGDHTQTIKYVDFDFVVGADGVKILQPVDEIDAKFLYYFIAANPIKSLGYARHYRLLKELSVPVPPLEEQKRIVAILDEAFAGIDQAIANTEQNILNACELFESFLNTIFTQKGDGWEENTLAEIAVDFGRGKSKHRPRNDPKLYGGDYPFIQTGDVRNSGHFIKEYSQTYNETGLAQSKLWPKGTLCITIAANIAETGVLSFDACFPDSIIGMVVDEKHYSISFIEYCLQFTKVQLQAAGKGSAQDNINLATFENWKFSFPSYEEQTKIVKILNTVDEQSRELIALYQQKLSALKELKQSLLQKAFAGELTSDLSEAA